MSFSERLKRAQQEKAAKEHEEKMRRERWIDPQIKEDERKENHRKKCEDVFFPILKQVQLLYLQNEGSSLTCKLRDRGGVEVRLGWDNRRDGEGVWFDHRTISIIIMGDLLRGYGNKTGLYGLSTEKLEKRGFFNPKEIKVWGKKITLNDPDWKEKVQGFILKELGIE